MSYIINYFHPKIETNIEDIPEIDLENFKINNISLKNIAFLKNIKISKKDITNMLTKQSLFSKFNMREHAEKYEKSNIVDKDSDYTIDNIQTITALKIRYYNELWSWLGCRTTTSAEKSHVLEVLAGVITASVIHVKRLSYR